MITIFTPTYNRAYILGKVFDSLMAQTTFNFEWLIIDDGSTDNTKDIVQRFDSQGKFPIRYIYKQNEGKHIAINYAAQHAEGEWVFIVDSDDTILPDAMQTVEHYINQIKDDDSFAGVVGLRGRSEDKIIAGEKGQTYSTTDSRFKDEYIDATAIEYRYGRKIQGDRAEIVRTDILKKYLFPKFGEERFMSEGVLWLRIAQDGYKFRWFNKIIYITEYLADGLTRNIKLANRRNCQSKAYFENLKLGAEQLPFKARYRCALHYLEYGWIAKKSTGQLFKESTAPFMTKLFYPIALLRYLIKESRNKD